MKYNLNINERAFKAIISKTKRVEIRTITGNTDYSKMNKDDIIEFKNDNNEKIVCKILEVNHYKTVEELVMLEGTRYTTSSTNEYEEAVNNLPKVEYQLDIMLWGTEEEKEMLLRDLGKEVAEIERRVNEYRRNQGTIDHNRQRSCEAVH